MMVEIYRYSSEDPYYLQVSFITYFKVMMEVYRYFTLTYMKEESCRCLPRPFWTYQSCIQIRFESGIIFLFDRSSLDQVNTVFQENLVRLWVSVIVSTANKYNQFSKGYRLQLRVDLEFNISYYMIRKKRIHLSAVRFSHFSSTKIPVN